MSFPCCYRAPLGIVAIGLVLAVSTAWSAEPVDDQKAIAGTWKPKEATLGDNKIDPLLLEKASLVIEGDQYTITVNDKIEKGTLKLDPKTSPKNMDIFPTQGTNNGKTLLAIYTLETDKLTVCYSIDGTMRPDDFEANSNTLLLVKYERLKTP